MKPSVTGFAGILLVAVVAQADPPLLDPPLGFTPVDPPLIATCVQNAPAYAIAQAVDWAHRPAGTKGLMVAYVDANNVATYQGFGESETGGGAPDKNTLFAIGSLTKLFTATLLARFAVDNSALLDSPVPVPNGFTNLRPNTTYKDLAIHHGGLPKNAARKLDTVSDLWTEYTSAPIQCTSNNPQAQIECGCCTTAYQTLIGGSTTLPWQCTSPNVSDINSLSCAIHGHTTGGSGWVYSNEGFSVLGQALARYINASSWHQANATYITTPLGMTDTVVRAQMTSGQEARAANNCSANGPNTDCFLLQWLPVGNAAGGLFSTASDLVKFLKYNMMTVPTACNVWTDPCDLYWALPIIHTTYDYSTASTNPAAMQNARQELGWQVKHPTVCGGATDIVWKDGANGPFYSWMAYVPSTHKGVVLLANAAGFDLASIGQTILVTAQ